MSAAVVVRRAAVENDARSIESRTTLWSPGLVEERLRKAVAVRAALVDGQMSGDRAMGRSPEIKGIIGGIGSATGNDGVIDMATEALSWLRWLEPDDAEIVLARLEGAPWKLICFRFGISRLTADRRWRYSLALIAWRLNGKARSEPIPSLRSLLGMCRAT